MKFNFGRYHRILGVSSDASIKEIKEAYIRLSKMYHPDINFEENAGEKFKIIAEAYNELKKEFPESEVSKATTQSTSKKSMNDHEKIYYEIFGKSYEDDPMEYYDPKNEFKRKEFERRANIKSHRTKFYNDNFEDINFDKNDTVFDYSDKKQHIETLKTPSFQINPFLIISGLFITFTSFLYLAFKDSLVKIL